VYTKLAPVVLAAVAAVLVAASADAAGAKGTRAHPYPMRTTVLLPKSRGWKLRVNGAVPNGTRLVLAASKHNFPPPAGEQYFLINVSMIYTGKGRDAPFSAFVLTSVGRTGLTYTSLNDDCGTPPKALNDFKKVPTGGKVTGNVCYRVRQQDAGALLLKAVPTSSAASIFFKLH
jgi:hypothetical protein